MRPLLPLAPLIALAASCHVVFPHAPGALRSDGSVEARALDLARESAALDGPRPDRAPLQGCVSPDVDALAVYTFDDAMSPYLDSTGKHPVAAAVGLVTTAIGASGCGSGLHVEPKDGLPSYLVIDHDADWDQVLAIELWVRFDRDPLPGSEAILSRDATGTLESGHFTLFRDCAGRLALRLQRLSALPELHLCSPVVIPKESWAHVVINFHPVELRVEGDSAQSDDEKGCGGVFTPCHRDTAFDHGIEGNKNPWVVGASSISSPQGTASVVTLGMAGTIDELRFSKARR